jgi:hypothetical protein
MKKLLTRARYTQIAIKRAGKASIAKSMKDNNFADSTLFASLISRRLQL